MTKTEKIPSGDMTKLLSIAVGFLAEPMLERISSGKYVHTTDRGGALDIVELCKSVVRHAVTSEAKTDDDNLVHAVAVMMVFAMQKSGFDTGIDLDFVRPVD